MGFDEFDEEYEGQMSIEDLFPVPQRMFAVSKIFARAKKQMNVDEYKTFVYALSMIDWTKPMPTSVELDKKVLVEILGLTYDADHLTRDLKRRIKDLSVHSFIEFTDEDEKLYISGTVVNTLILTRRNKAILDFNPRYCKLFSELTSDYITMWSSDIFNMRSERSITFYEHLRAHSDTTQECQKGFGIKALKELFDIPVDAYMREKGGFDRKNFEKYVIEPICEDLANCEMLQLIVQPDGKLYEKVKDGARVKGYRFYWNVSDRPKIANATEIKELRENIAKDPKILKIAKDASTGEKRKKLKEKKQNTFTNYQQNEINFAELEEQLLDN